MTAPRDYKAEYAKFQASPKQIKDRALRNKARRIEGLKKGDGREVDHITPMAKGGKDGKKNLEVTTRHDNRVKGKRYSGPVKGD